MKEQQKKKLWIGIFAGLVVGVITLIGIAVVIGAYFLFGGPAQVTTDISRYEEVMSKYPNVQTGFLVFPETLPKSAGEVEFYFSYQDVWDDPACQVFLQCTYNEEDYQLEKKRLEAAKKVYGSKEQTLLQAKEGIFNYPCYVAVFNYNYAYEYALLTGEHEITYIYVSFISKDEIQFDKDYLPCDHEKAKEADMENYSIYLSSYMDFDQDGVIDSWDCDYTRTENVPVYNYHYVEIGYNTFTVTTKLDEKDREMIENCSYNSYEDKHDYLYGYPDEQEFTELAGYEFVEISLNQEQTQVTVSYIELGKTKKMVYDIPEEDK